MGPWRAGDSRATRCCFICACKRKQQKSFKNSEKKWAILSSQLFSSQNFCWQNQPWWEITMGFCLFSCSRTWWLESLNYCWFSDVPLDAVRGTMWHGMGWHGGTPWDVGYWAGHYRNHRPTMGFVLQSWVSPGWNQIPTCQKTPSAASSFTNKNTFFWLCICLSSW